MSEFNLTRQLVESRGVNSLKVDSLTFDDLVDIGWAGGPLHVEAVRNALMRVADYEVDYLAVRDVEGHPISIGAVDYVAQPGAGTLWQLSTEESLRGLGVGARLIESLERKIKERGLTTAVLSVEETNPKAKALYERLGYRIYGHGVESWDEMDETGLRYVYSTSVHLLRKSL